MPCGACLSFTKNNPQGELKNKQKRRLNVYLTKNTNCLRYQIYWWQFTPKLEPISSVKAELRRLSPNACGHTRPLAPPEKPFELSF
jgi:hypothetical protein